MKMMKNERIFGICKTTSLMGWLFSAIGLVLFAIALMQTVPALIKGDPINVSSTILLIESVSALFCLIMGFGLMVFAADPFDDVSYQFDQSESHRTGLTDHEKPAKE